MAEIERVGILGYPIQLLFNPRLDSAMQGIDFVVGANYVIGHVRIPTDEGLEAGFDHMLGLSRHFVDAAYTLKPLPVTDRSDNRRNVFGQITDSLQPIVDLQNGDHEPQIRAVGPIILEDIDARLLDENFESIDFGVFFDDRLGQESVASDQGRDGPRDRHLDKSTEFGLNLTLNWGDSCQSSDGSYAVYEGTIGDFGSHERIVCSTGGLTTHSFEADTSSTYYLVVPTNGSLEGSYGRASSGDERPSSLLACRPQAIGSCD